MSQNLCGPTESFDLIRFLCLEWGPVNLLEHLERHRAMSEKQYVYGGSC